MIVEKSFAYFPITGASVELIPGSQQLQQFARVGYQQVAEWGECVAGAYVKVIALTFPEAPAGRLLKKLDFSALCRRLIAKQQKQEGSRRAA